MFVVDGPNIKQIRSNFDLSQSQFAAMLGISISTLRNWEQGRRTPNGPAKILLQVAALYCIFNLGCCTPNEEGRTSTGIGQSLQF